MPEPGGTGSVPNAGEPPAVEPAVTPVAAEPAPVAPVEPAPVTPAAEPPVEPVATDWRERRLAQQTARLRAAEEELARLKAASPPVPPAAPAADPAEFEARVAAEATRREFNRQCEGVANAGRLAFPDFDARVAELVRVVDRNDPGQVQAYNNLVSAAIETGEAHKLIHALGGNLNEASRLLGLPPVKLGLELAKLAARPEALTSKTAKPISPVGGRGAPHTAIDPTDPERSDTLSTREWMKRREAQVVEKGGRA